MKRYIQAWRASLGTIYGVKDEDAKGRLIILSDSLITTIYNVFISGIFYTGFLTMYGMSITDTGILSFIPSIASLLSIFSSKILGRFKRRKAILLGSKLIFYALYIIAITLMPQFITEPEARMNSFIIILFVAYGFYALVSPGFTTWFYNFYPEDNERRTRFLTLNQIFSSILSSIVLLFSSLLTDALSGSKHQDTLILFFRYFSFVLVLVDLYIQSKAKEYPYLDAAKTKLKDIFTVPFKYKKFLFCMILTFVWNYNNGLTSSVWGYHLLNHMNFSYTLINAMSILYTFILLLFASPWRKLLSRYSWIKTWGIAVLLWVPTEFLFFCMTPDRPYMYVPLCIIQHILSVGVNLSYSNILYMNLPAEHSTVCISFYSIGTNAFLSLGLISGTWISSISGDETMRVLGMDIFSVQFNTICRAVIMTVMGIILVVKWRSFTRDADIEDVERQKILRSGRAR